MKEFLIEHAIAIVAAICAMITMFFAILNYFSRNKRSSKIIYHPREALNIYNSLTNEFKGFDIKYNDEPISSRIIYISGELICKGKDINSLKNQITIKSPTSCKWIDISISNKDSIKASASISKDNEQEAILSFDKLRRDKSFTISAILQTNIDLKEMPVTSVHETIEFEHSINDTDDVKMLTSKNSPYDISFMLAIGSGIGFSIGFLCSLFHDSVRSSNPEAFYSNILILGFFAFLSFVLLILHLLNKKRK